MSGDWASRAAAAAFHGGKEIYHARKAPSSRIERGWAAAAPALTTWITGQTCTCLASLPERLLAAGDSKGAVRWMDVREGRLVAMHSEQHDSPVANLFKLLPQLVEEESGDEPVDVGDIELEEDSKEGAAEPPSTAPPAAASLPASGLADGAVVDGMPLLLSRDGDGKMAAFACQGPAAEWRPVALPEQVACLSACCAATSGSDAVFGRADGSTLICRVYCTADGRLRWQTAELHAARLPSQPLFAALSPELVLLASEDEFLIFDRLAGSVVDVLPCASRPRRLLLSGDVFVLLLREEALAWDATTDGFPLICRFAVPGAEHAALLSTQPRVLALSAGGAVIKFFRLLHDDAQCVATVDCDGAVTVFASSAAGERLLAGHATGHVSMWSPAGDDLLSGMEVHRSAVTAMLVDDVQVLTAGDDRTMRVLRFVAASVELEQRELEQRYADEAAIVRKRGNSALKKGRPAAALEAYNQALRLDARNLLLFANRAQAQLQLFNYTACIQDALQAHRLFLQHAPPRPAAHSLLAKLYDRRAAAQFGLGDYLAAVRACLTALQYDMSESRLTQLRAFVWLLTSMAHLARISAGVGSHTAPQLLREEMAELLLQHTAVYWPDGAEGSDGEDDDGSPSLPQLQIIDWTPSHSSAQLAVDEEDIQLWYWGAALLAELPAAAEDDSHEPLYSEWLLFVEQAGAELCITAYDTYSFTRVEGSLQLSDLLLAEAEEEEEEEEAAVLLTTEYWLLRADAAATRAGEAGAPLAVTACTLSEALLFQSKLDEAQAAAEAAVEAAQAAAADARGGSWASCAWLRPSRLHARAAAVLAYIAMRRGHHEAAAALFTQSLEQHDSTEVRNALQALREDMEALSSESKADSRSDADRAAALKEEGNAAFRDRRWAAAEAAYSAALDVLPSAALYSNRAAARLQLRRFELADADCRAGLAGEPDAALQAKLLARQAAALVGAGRAEDALRAVAAAEQLRDAYEHPKLADWKAAAEGALAAGRRRTARDDAKEAAANGDRCLMAGDAADAINYYEQAERIPEAATLSTYHLLLVNHAVALNQLSREEEALALCEKATAAKPDYEDSWALQAQLQIVLHRYVDATATLLQACPRFESSVALHDRLRDCLLLRLHSQTAAKPEDVAAAFVAARADDTLSADLADAACAELLATIKADAASGLQQLRELSDYCLLRRIARLVHAGVLFIAAASDGYSYAGDSDSKEDTEGALDEEERFEWWGKRETDS